MLKRSGDEIRKPRAVPFSGPVIEVAKSTRGVSHGLGREKKERSGLLGLPLICYSYGPGTDVAAGDDVYVPNSRTLPFPDFEHDFSLRALKQTKILCKKYRNKYLPPKCIRSSQSSKQEFAREPECQQKYGGNDLFISRKK